MKNSSKLLALALVLFMGACSTKEDEVVPKTPEQVFQAALSEKNLQASAASGIVTVTAAGTFTKEAAKYGTLFYGTFTAPTTGTLGSATYTAADGTSVPATDVTVTLMKTVLFGKTVVTTKVGTAGNLVVNIATTTPEMAANVAAIADLAVVVALPATKFATSLDVPMVTLGGAANATTASTIVTAAGVFPIIATAATAAFATSDGKAIPTFTTYYATKVDPETEADFVSLVHDSSKNTVVLLNAGGLSFVGRADVTATAAVKTYALKANVTQ